MKTHAHNIPLRSNWKDPFAKGEVPKRGVHWKPSVLQVMQSGYRPTGVRQRVANLRRVKGGYKAVGMEEIIVAAKGEFHKVVGALREQGYTGYKMGKIVAVI